MEIILREDSTMMQLHLSKIVPQLMQLATNSTTNGSCPQIRELALQHPLPGFEQLSVAVVERYKSLVLKQLEVCLDDKKRNVRKLAIDLRQILYEMR